MDMQWNRHKLLLGMGAAGLLLAASAFGQNESQQKMKKTSGTPVLMAKVNKPAPMLVAQATQTDQPKPVGVQMVPMAAAQLGSDGAFGTISFLGTLGDGHIILGISPVPPRTCTMYGLYQFIFDSSTLGGRNMYALLLAAKMAGKNIQFDYTDSSTPGTDQSSGCSLTTLAVPGDMLMPN